MRLLHTSDWHVGKNIRGRSRADEHRAVLDEIARLAAEHTVDLVLVAGDLFETASPSAEAETIVYRALLQLARTGAEVAVIAGHDNGRRLQAVAPVFSAAGRVHVLARPGRPDDGGVLRLRTGAGEDVRLAMLPFVSQRGIVRAKDLMDSAAYENTQAYAERMRLVIDALAAGFEPGTVNVLMAHAFVHGGQLGGGERDQPKQVNLVDIEPGLPPTVMSLPLSSGRALRTVSGTLAELNAVSETLAGEPWLRVIVRESRRAGLADDVRDLLGERVVDVRVEDSSRPTTRRSSHAEKSPVVLFDEFLGERNIGDDRVRAQFKRLLDAQLEADQDQDQP